MIARMGIGTLLELKDYSFVWVKNKDPDFRFDESHLSAIKVGHEQIAPKHLTWWEE